MKQGSCPVPPARPQTPLKVEFLIGISNNRFLLLFDRIKKAELFGQQPEQISTTLEKRSHNAGAGRSSLSGWYI